MRTLLKAAPMVALFVVGASVAGAEPLYERPLFNPATQSYFELVVIKDPEQASSNSKSSKKWEDANRLAGQRTYKGVPGRLAVVDRPETHQFIRTHFGNEGHTWFGLRYWCDYRVLQWSTGERHPHHGFSAWDSQWDQSGTCPKGEYLAIAYSRVTEGFRWIAKGMTKGYEKYLVEYPTGKE